MTKIVEVNLPDRKEYRLYNANGPLHNENGKPAIVHGEKFAGAIEFFDHGERHNEYGSAVRLGDLDVAFFIRGVEFKTLEQYELAIFNMNVVMDLVEEILASK